MHLLTFCKILGFNRFNSCDRPTMQMLDDAIATLQLGRLFSTEFYKHHDAPNQINTKMQKFFNMPLIHHITKCTAIKLRFSFKYLRIKRNSRLKINFLGKHNEWKDYG